MSESHYDVLGVAPGASRDEIRDAYRERVSELDPDSWKGDAADRRTQAASVNKAWNVLSDPFQKERYDAALESGAAVATDDAPPSPGTIVAADATSPSDSGDERVGRGGRRPAVTKLTPTGRTVAPTRSRINALAVDVLVIFAIVVGVNALAGAVFGEPAVQVTIKDKVVATEQLDGRSYAAAKGPEQQKAIADWKKDNKGEKLNEKKDVKTDKVSVVPGDISLAVQGLTLLLALAYTCIPSALAGRTLGKRLFKLELIGVDGSRAGWAKSLIHYGVPIAVALALALPGAVIAMGMVLWSIWDKAGQGVNDKIAKTFVVER